MPKIAYFAFLIIFLTDLPCFSLDQCLYFSMMSVWAIGAEQTNSQFVSIFMIIHFAINNYVCTFIQEKASKLKSKCL